MSVSIQIEGEGLSYSKEANIIQAAKIIGFLNTDEGLPSDSTRNRPEPLELLDNSARAQKLSPREAIVNSAAKTNAQKILVLGDFINSRDETDEFTLSDLKPLFLKAGEPAPRNFGRDIKDATKLGFIVESDDKSGSYVITNTGYETLKEGFANTSKPRKHTRNHSASGVRKNHIPDWLAKATFDDAMDGFPSYREMSKRSDKVLWIIQWANSQGKDRVKGIEIEYIADRLADSVPNKQVANATSPYIPKYIGKTAEGYKILHPGSVFLKTLGGQNE